MRETKTPAIQALLALGRKRGQVTYAELKEALEPEVSYSAAQIEDVMALLTEEQINVVEK